MNSREKLKAIIREAKNSPHIIMNDLADRILMLLNAGGLKDLDIKDFRYKIEYLLEIYNPAFQKDIEVLKQFDEHFEAIL